MKMKLTDIQKAVLNSTILDYVECKRKDPENDLGLLTQVEGHLYCVLCLIYNTGAPDPKIEINMSDGRWTTPEEVIQYIELTA
jgi:hypothetical protein